MTCTTASLCEDHQRLLDELGYVVFERLMSDELLESLRARMAELYAAEGEQAGAEFKQEPGCLRLANLVAKGPLFAEVIARGEVLASIGHLLGPRYKLSSLNARTALPGCAAQPLHADMGAIADEAGYWVANSVWMLDDFTTENGALRVVPGSQRWRTLPQTALDSPAAAHPDEVLVTGKAGTVVVMNAHLWHGGTANRTNRPRTAVHAFYCRWDKPQQQHQKALLPADVQAGLSRQLRDLLALDDPYNDELAASSLPRSGFLK